MAESASSNTLTSLMEEANLGPRALTAEINRAFGAGTVSQTAAYHWRDGGRVPHERLRPLIAHVLSMALGRSISVDQIWGKMTAGPPLIPATDGMDTASTRHLLEGLVQGGMMDRRQLMCMSGAALTTAVATFLSGRIPKTPEAEARASESTHPLIAQVEQTVQSLQYLDDDYGGAANLGYVGAQVRATALVLVESAHETTVSRRLQVALADCAQLAGWMAFDAGKQGLAQRYMLLGLRIANEAGYRDMAAHILGDLSFQASTYGTPRDAVELGEAALTTSSRSSPAVLASVQSRLAYAYARAGRMDDARRARDSGLDQLSKPRKSLPKWLYFLTPAHIESQAGYALIHGGHGLLAQGLTKAARTSIAEGVRLLRNNGAWSLPLGDTGQRRRALFEGGWLAAGHLYTGDIEATSSVLQATIPRLEQVNSRRSIGVLEQLRRELSRRQRNEYARSTLAELEPALRRFGASAA